MNYISNLPCEVLNHILMQENINFTDALNLSFTCKALHIQICKGGNELFFQHLFLRSWPAFEKKWRNEEVDIKIEITKRLKFKIRFSKWFLRFVREMGNRPSLERLVDQMKYAYRMFNLQSKENLDYHYFKDELMQILGENRKDIGIARKYYARRLLTYMKHEDLEAEWLEFVKLPVEKQILERIAIMISQWCQPEKRLLYPHISKMLNDLVQEILHLLRKEHPTHSILATSREQFSFWERNNISANHWDKIETIQIIDIMQRHICNRFSFISLSGERDLTWLLMDNVLEHNEAHNKSISLIFSCIARRLGVRCDFIFLSMYPYSYVLCWREDYNESRSLYYIINISNIGKAIIKENIIIPCLNEYEIRTIYNHNTCRFDTSDNYNTLKLLLYMTSIVDQYYLYGLGKRDTVNRLLRSFLYMTNPDDPEPIERAFIKDMYADPTEIWILMKNEMDKNSTMYNYGHYGLWTTKFMENATRTVWKLLQTCFERKKRTKEVKYAIGMIVEIKTNMRRKYGDYIKCVIVGWDVQYVHPPITLEPRNVNSGWFDSVRSRREEELRLSSRLMLPSSNSLEEDDEKKPFYEVLHCGDRRFYICQDRIRPAKIDYHIDHYEIGRYFGSFKQTHYVPHMFLENAYPQDKAVRERYTATLN